MRKEDISVFADMKLEENQRIVIFYNENDNSIGIEGYFENNDILERRNRNFWNFVRLPLIKGTDRYTVINGDEIVAIKLIVR